MVVRTVKKIHGRHPQQSIAENRRFGNGSLAGNFWLGFDNAQTVAIHAALKTLAVPTLTVSGLQDIFFDKKWAYWLNAAIPGTRRVIEIEDRRLFFPEDRPDALAPALHQFWDELGQ
jgi:pimeloyl-ACP methyl ester carboxylesterase